MKKESNYNPIETMKEKRTVKNTERTIKRQDSVTKRKRERRRKRKRKKNKTSKKRQ